MCTFELSQTSVNVATYRKAELKIINKYVSELLIENNLISQISIYYGEIYQKNNG
jgi:hypothetical protein